MALFGVGIVPIEIGLAFLGIIGAVAGLYVLHMQFLCRHVRRVQRERSLALNDSRPAREADAEGAPASDRAFGPVLGLSSAQSLWVRNARSRSAEPERQSFAHGVNA
jgi:hypothetical protein